MNTVHLMSRALPVVAIMLSSQQVQAIDFVGKLAIGKKSSELIIVDRSFRPEFTTLDLSLTGTRDRFFVTINNEFSIKDDVSAFDDSNDAFDGLIFYSREDLNLTFGYSLDDYAVFAGFRSGKTDAHYTAQNNAFSTTSDGFYVGASSGYFVEGVGNLTGSVAVASLDGEVSLTEPLVDTTAFTVTTPPANIKGSAVGLSIGVGLQGEVTPSTLYSIDLKINQFDFEDDVVFGGLDLSYEENFTTFYIGLTHFFD